MASPTGGSSYAHVQRTPRFSWQRLFAYPGPLGDYDAVERRKRVCVVGGGIGGLVAAYELKQLGHDVTLLERTERCRGRIETHRFSDGTYGELGAMRIPKSHGCVWHYIETFGLDVHPFVMENEATWLHFRGFCERRGRWSQLARQVFPRPASAGMRSKNIRVKPDDVIGEIARRAWDLLSDVFRWHAFAQSMAEAPTLVTGTTGDAEELDRLLAYEALSLWQYMTGRRSPAAGTGPTLYEEEWEYLARVTTDLPYERVSFLDWLIDHESLRTAAMFTISGGMECLVDALIAELGQSVRTRCEVRRIAVDHGQNRVEVDFDSPTAKASECFDYVICAIPASAASAIVWEPDLPAAQREALTNVSYFPAAKTLVRCRSRRWEWEDGIYGGGSATDLPHQQSWYPSDNAQEPPADSEHYLHSGPEETDGTLETQPMTWRPLDEGRSREPGAFLAAYMWGPAAAQFAALPNDGARTEAVLTSVERIHSWIRTECSEVVHRVWDVGGGGFAAFAPGERLRYQPIIGQPHPKADPRVFFAGEHLGILHGWIQSSVQSALAATIDVLAGR